MTIDRRLLPHAGAFVGSCLVGAAVVATRVAVDEIEPVGLAFLRYGQGALVLFLALILFTSTPIRATVPEVRSFAGLGILMFALFPVLFNTALQFTTASRGAVILATMPLWGALLARRFAGERLRTGQVAGVLLSFAGVAMVFAESGLGVDGGGRVIAGNLLMLCTAIVGGVYAVRAKPVMSTHSPAKVTAWAMLAGAALLFVPALVEGLPGQLRVASTNTLLLVLYLGTFGGAVAFWMFAYTLGKLSPTQALVYINVNPVVATIFASIFLDEKLTATFGIGFATVIVGLLLTNLPKRAGKTSLMQPNTRS